MRNNCSHGRNVHELSWCCTHMRKLLCCGTTVVAAVAICVMQAASCNCCIRLIICVTLLAQQDIGLCMHTVQLALRRQLTRSCFTCISRPISNQLLFISRTTRFHPVPFTPGCHPVALALRQAMLFTRPQIAPGRRRSVTRAAYSIEGASL